jgi:ribosome biogenesis protein MAK21
MLVFQLMSSRSTVSDRFYRALYAVLGTDGPHAANRSPMFLSLLFKAMKVRIAGRTAKWAAWTARLLLSR